MQWRAEHFFFFIVERQNEILKTYGGLAIGEGGSVVHALIVRQISSSNDTISAEKNIK